MSLTGDIKIRWDIDTMQGDFLFEDNDLETDEGLGNAYLISVFTDKRARPDQRLPDPDTDDLRGWWGDSYSDIFNDPDGSHVWTLSREKTELKVIPLIEQFLRESVEWAITDKVVARNEVFAERSREPGNDLLGFRVRAFRQGESEPAVDLLFDDLWSATFT